VLHITHGIYLVWNIASVLLIGVCQNR